MAGYRYQGPGIPKIGGPTPEDYQEANAMADDRKGKKPEPLDTEIESLKAQLAEAKAQLEAIIERDRTKVAECVTAIKETLYGYHWLTEGRGPYAWNDDRWHKEFETAHNAILETIQPMVKIAADWSDSPKTQDKVQEARSGCLAAAEYLQSPTNRKEWVIGVADDFKIGAVGVYYQAGEYIKRLTPAAAQLEAYIYRDEGVVTTLARIAEISGNEEDFHLDDVNAQAIAHRDALVAKRGKV